MKPVSLNEAAVETTTLKWLWELDDVVSHNPHFVPNEAAVEQGVQSALKL